MDSVDLKIIGLLMHDSQMPFSELAKTLDLGVDTVIRRYNKLRSDGVVNSAAVAVNLKKCGFKGHVIFLVSTDAGAEPERLYDEFIKIPNVLSVVNTIGDHDLQIHCVYSDVDGLTLLQKEITKVSGIHYLSTIIFSANDFIPDFPSTEYCSKVISKAPVNYQAKH
jgi:DNA-binding Lrp family transcriptional regulator